MSDLPKLAVIAATQALTDVCDGAHDHDRQGFNASDARMGHALSILPAGEWPDELVYGWASRLAKYRRQLEAMGMDYEAIASIASETHSHRIEHYVEQVKRERARRVLEARKRQRQPAASIKFDSGKFTLKFPYDAAVVDRIRALEGRRFLPATKAWAVQSTPANVEALFEIAAMLQISPIDEMYAEQDRFARIELARQEATQFHDEASADDIDLSGVGVNTPLWGHQKRAVAYASTIPAALWDCGMGTGKTLSAITLLCRERPAKTLVVAPKSVMPVWPTQIQDHAPAIFRTHVLDPRRTTTRRAADMVVALRDASVVRPTIIVTNYDSMWRNKLGKEILATDWDLIIFDEAHRIKSPGGKAAKFAERLGQRNQRKLALTGTPMPHSPLDIYSLYRFLDSSIFGTSLTRFRSNYCVMGGFEGREILKWKNQDEMRAKINSIRFEATRDVLDLPEAVHSTIEVTLEPKTRKAYLQLRDHLVAWIKKGGTAEEPVTADNVLVKLLRLQQITSGYLPWQDDEGVTHTTPLGTEKEQALCDLLDDTGDEPVVVFCRFHSDLEAVHRAAKSRGGSNELSGRVDELAKWQGGEHRVLACQIQAGAEGVTMVRARRTVYYNLPWSLGQYEQSLARSHRPGQTDTVFYHSIVAKGTVDKQVQHSLAARKSLVKAIMQGETIEG